MFSALIQRAEVQLSNKLPFVLYRKPKLNAVIGIFQETSELHTITDYSVRGFVFAPFDNVDNTILIPVNEKIISTDFEPTYLSSSTKFEIDSSQRDFHIELVEKGIAKIKAGSFKKVVLSRRLQVEIGESPTKLFEKLLNTYSSAFCYLWHHPKVGTWLGATPEILLRTENDRLITMSLAGTQTHTENKKVEWGRKELEEQALVTDYIKKVLDEKVTDLKVAELETLRAGSLLHLRTRITGNLNTDLKKIITALHPTPAVCGMPLSPAKEFIKKHEHYDREFYTGFLGELNFKQVQERTSNKKNLENRVYRTVKTCSELFVNLRCTQLLGDSAFVYVGGGVTSESVPEKEWVETINKSRTMLNVLQEH